MLHTWQADLNAQQGGRVGQGLWRERAVLGSPQSTHVLIKGNALVNFSSNDYLGLANDIRLQRAANEALADWGVGSGASHMVCGHLAPHAQLEKELADFLGAERALLFSNGYMANLALCTALLDKHDAIVQDKLNHASLIDGARLSAARSLRYRHASVAHAKQIMQRSEARRHLLVTDGVFSMDGDIAPLAELNDLAVAHNGLLVVDDAHGFGVLGEQGRGALSTAGLSPRKHILMMGTLGKALGSFGAFVAGDALYIDHLIQYARSYIYTTALPPTAVAASICGLRLLSSDRRELLMRLRRNIRYFRAAAQSAGLSVLPSTTAIQPLIIGDPQQTLRISQLLCRDGFMVVAIRPPTVGAGTSRLRITLSAKHELNEIDDLVASLTLALSN